MSKKKRQKERRAQAEPAADAAAAQGIPPGNLALLIKRFAIFGGFVIAFYAITALPWFRESFFPAYLNLNAKLSALMLSMLGESASADGMLLMGERYRLLIQRGCDAIEPAMLFVGGVLVAPMLPKYKWQGLLVCIPLILFLNVIRIVSLYYTGVFFPELFEIVHVDVWQAVFVLLTIVIWGLWAAWATKRERAAAAAA